MKRNILNLIILICLLSSCERRDILDDNTVWVKVRLDWDSAELNPNGTSIWFFPTRSELKPQVLRTNEKVDSIKLPRDYYSIIAFNETEKDHSGIIFRNTDDYKTFEAYTDKSQEAETINDIPEMLAAYSKDNFEITWDMVNSGCGPSITITPQKMLYTINFTLRVKGVDNARLASSYGYINGLAAGVNLATHTRSTETTSNKFVFSKLTLDQGSYQQGTITGKLFCFGLADGGVTRATNTKFVIKFKLRDESVYTVERDITSLLKVTDDRNLILTLDLGLDDSEGSNPIIELPEVPSSDPTDGSGFDADVNDWGEVIEIEVPVK